MLYVVCTQCTFLRAFSQRAGGTPPPERCPACGGSVVMQRKAGRFQPTYVGRVSLDLHSRPPLERSPERADGPPGP